MKLSIEDLHKLSVAAKNAATLSGQFISNFDKKRLEVNNKKNKTDGSSPTGESLASQVVTQVDIESQSIILKALQPTITAFDLGLLTEELSDDQSRHEKDFFWCIDPLDGTLPFTEGTSGYAVSIALVSKSGESIVSVVYDPVQAVCYHAIKNNGVFRNGKPFSFPVPNTKLTFITDRSFQKHKKFEWVLDELEQIAEKLGLEGVESIHHGGAVMNACWVANQSPACYFKFPKDNPGGGSLWDYAATSCLLTAMGAHVSDSFGASLMLNQANSFMNRNGIIYASDTEIGQMIIDMYAKIHK